ncbi:hypothetical protein niasHT_020524 [Heterodera trifolii]|uniref:G domain-containing protein n=1 Tax=Heterodera trifolii TaxID=157864 RepID=A0ABD2J9H1_9BILA
MISSIEMFSSLCPFVVRHKCFRCSARTLAFSGHNLFDYLPAAQPSSRSQKAREILKRHQHALKRRPKKWKGAEFGTFVEQMDSIAAKCYLGNNIDQFASLARAKSESEAKMETLAEQKLSRKRSRESSDSANAPLLPYDAKTNPAIFAVADNENEENALTFSSVEEKGFFVCEDPFQDEYAAGSTAELPEEEMTEVPVAYFGNVNEAMENIEFQLPGQSFENKKTLSINEQNKVLANEEVGDWLSNYGETVPTEGEANIRRTTLENAKCAGCGANFHCHNPSLPGFMPLELYQEVEKNANQMPKYQRTDYQCRRCYLLKEHNFLLNLNVSPVDYESMMGHLKMVHEALILLIVDMTDMEASINRQLPTIIGTKKPMIVIGNKIDLLPPDFYKGYLHHFLASLKAAMHKAGVAQQFNILKYLLLSAKTGFGVEDLITNIYQKWVSPRGSIRSDIYVVGSTNAGKSTLFNAFLQSDLCKVRAMDLVERVTTSIWPGTTLSLLKFPIMSPSTQQLEVRRRRLLAMQAWKKKESLMLRSAFSTTKHPKYVVLQGIIGSSFREWEENKQPMSVDKTIKYFDGQLENADEIAQIEGNGPKKRTNMNLNDFTFKQGNWCFDTPGTVNSEQLLDLFTLDELINVVPRSIITPRIFSLKTCHSLLIGGLVRIDLLEIDTQSITHQPTVFLTVFASNRLRIELMDTPRVDGFLRRFNGHPSLGAPIGGPKRMDKFPKLEPCDFVVQNEGAFNEEEAGFADIVFSSVGWALLTSSVDSVKIRAWTPAGKGLLLRQPPLLPYAAKYRGQRQPGTDIYRTRPLQHCETFSDTQRSERPKRIVGENYKAPPTAGQIMEYVNFDFD